MHFGIISPPVPGHIHPMGALGRELISRGHRATLIHMEDVRTLAQKQGLEFASIGATDHSPGSLPVSLGKLGKLEGFSALRFTIQAVQKTTEMFCRDAPEVITGQGIEMLLVDQTEPAGGTIADYLKLPFITIANALALNQESSVPPPFSDWAYRDRAFARARNRAGYTIGRFVMKPVTRTVEKYRRLWNLPAFSTPDQSFSPLAQICQLPPAFDYPRRQMPPTFHYTGPLRQQQVPPVPFPWERLTGRPLIYASLGTLQNNRESVFRCFAEACEPLDVQLVISHGGGLTQERAASLSSKVLVVPYAPQLELLKRAALTITHAGLNTVLDSLTHSVPLVAVPITYEQPAIAARIRWSGSGIVIPFPQLKVETLRSAVTQVLKQDTYRDSARRIAASIQAAGGVSKAADIVESVISSRSQNPLVPTPASLH